MNRRAFLIGTAATAVALRVPTIAEIESEMYGLTPMMVDIPDGAIITDFVGYIVWAKDQTICYTGIKAEDFYK